MLIGTSKSSFKDCEFVVDELED